MIKQTKWDTATQRIGRIEKPSPPESKAGLTGAAILSTLGLLALFGLMAHTLEAYDNVYSHKDINKSSIEKFARDVSFDIFGKQFKPFRKYDFLKTTYKMEGYAIKESGTFKVEEKLLEMPNRRNYQIWIKWGGYSADEPELYSSLRHFYDPLKLQRDRTTGKKVTYLTDHVHALLDQVNQHANKGIYTWWHKKASTPLVVDPRMDAREWALTGPARRGYPENKYSLRKGVEYMRKAWAEKNTKQKERLFAAAWRSCGETMHLLSDMTVPAHVRNDAHPAATVFSGLRYDPYEHFVAKNHKKIATWARRKADPKIAGKIDASKDMASLFHVVALYTNENFFSADTLTGKKENGEMVHSANGMVDYPSPSLDRCDLDLERFYIDRKTKIHVAHADWADNTWWNVRNYLRQKLLPGMSNNFNAAYSYEDVIMDQAKLLIPVAVRANIKLLSMFIPQLTVKLKGWNEKNRELSGSITHILSGVPGKNPTVYADPSLYPAQRPFSFNSGNGRGKSWSQLVVNGKSYSENRGHYALTITDNHVKISLGEKIKLKRNGENTAQLNLFFGGFWVRSKEFTFNLNDSMRPPIASPSDTEFKDRLTVSLSSPDGGVVVYRVNGGPLTIYSAPLVLTETSEIKAYADKDPHDKNALSSESVFFNYKKVNARKKSGRWVLYKSSLIDGVSFYKHECYTATGSAGKGSWQVAKSASTCSSNASARSGSGTYSVPPAELIPGESVKLKVTVSGTSGFGTTMKVIFYGRSKGLKFDSHGSGSFSPNWSRSVVRKYTSQRSSYPSEADFKIPENLNKNGVIMIEASGGGGNFELSETYVFLYQWKE